MNMRVGRSALESRILLGCIVYMMTYVVYWGTPLRFMFTVVD